LNSERIVEAGYDKISQLYHRRRVERFWSVAPDLNSFLKLVAAGGAVLDAGCGSGYIASIMEKRGFTVTGIDISTKMLELARKNATQSTFRRMNMRKLDFPNETFDGVLCLYSIIHVPRRYHLGILRGFRRVLKPKGILAIHMGWSDWVGIEDNWLGTGVPLYWSHFGRGKNLDLVKKAKFDVKLSRASRQKDGTHLFVLAQRK